jgi:5-methyltetrahydrofolate--homocysteine methyltransferase
LVSEFDVPLCLDSANPKALAAALEVTPGRPLVNSVTGEQKSMDAILPIVRDYDVPVIGLVMDDDGIPQDAEARLAVAERIIERAATMGIAAKDIVIDPLVLTVGADSQAGAVTLQTVELVSRNFGVNINLGASNVSFGLPDRHTLNQAFLGLAIHAGATCAITDPMKLTPIIRAADLLMGRDSFGTRYIRDYRRRTAEQGA